MNGMMRCEYCGGDTDSGLHCVNCGAPLHGRAVSPRQANGPSFTEQREQLKENYVECLHNMFRRRVVPLPSGESLRMKVGGW